MKNRGYTLIELMVAIGVFAIVMTLAMGAYLVTISLDREAQLNSKAVNTLSFALESMARGMRSGEKYTCNGTVSDCAPGDTFSYTDISSGDTIMFALNTGTLPDGVTPFGNITERINGGGAFSLTDPSVTITSLQFYMTGGAPHDQAQPYVTMVVSGNVPGSNGAAPVPFTLQTGAILRTIDI